MKKKKSCIILAAGMGTRLKPLTESEHKCMTKVCKKPIIYNAVDILEANGIDEIIVVLGYLKEKVEEVLKKHYKNTNLIFAYNDDYKNTNTVFSLKKGIEKLNDFDELYVIEGDVFFSSEVFKRISDCENENATVLEPYNQDLDGTFAEIDQKGWVIDWRHKSDQGVDYCITDKYKTVNIHKFNYAFVENKLKVEVEKTINEGNIKFPIEKTMKNIVNNNKAIVKGVVLKGEKWFEIDDANDLKKAEEIFKKVNN